MQHRHSGVSIESIHVLSLRFTDAKQAHKHLRGAAQQLLCNDLYFYLLEISRCSKTATSRVYTAARHLTNNKMIFTLVLNSAATSYFCHYLFIGHEMTEKTMITRHTFFICCVAHAPVHTARYINKNNVKLRASARDEVLCASRREI